MQNQNLFPHSLEPLLRIHTIISDPLNEGFKIPHSFPPFLLLFTESTSLASQVFLMFLFHEKPYSLQCSPVNKNLWSLLASKH